MVPEWISSRFLGASQLVVRKFYKYLVLWLIVAGIFFFLTISFYCPQRTSTASPITLGDFLTVANEPHKRKRILKKNETRCRAILETIFKLPFTSVRPDPPRAMPIRLYRLLRSHHL